MTNTAGIFSIEITGFMTPEILEKTGRVFEICVSDMVPTHLCEITPSYAMDFLRYETENHLSDDDYEDIMGWQDEDSYIHVSSAMKLKHETEILTDDYTFEDFREYHQGNHTFEAF